MIPYQLDTLQLTQEKEKSSAAQCFTEWFKEKNWLWGVWMSLEMQQKVPIFSGPFVELR